MYLQQAAPCSNCYIGIDRASVPVVVLVCPRQRFTPVIPGFKSWGQFRYKKHDIPVSRIFGTKILVDDRICFHTFRWFNGKAVFHLLLQAPPQDLRNIAGVVDTAMMGTFEWQVQHFQCAAHTGLFTQAATLCKQRFHIDMIV